VTRTGEREREMRPYRTVLEQKIRERRQTYEEFAEYVETFAREHKEPGTLGVRHLQRLAAGRGPGGKPLGRVLPTTARLLEQILGVNIDELLAPPSDAPTVDDAEIELRQRLHTSKNVDQAMLALLHEQLDAIRRLDRQLGATVAHDEAIAKTKQVANLLTHSVSRKIRQRLASLLSELHCLAGWQALDLGNITQSWQHYDQANFAAVESDSYSFKALATAGRAFVLVDIGDTATAVDLISSARTSAERKCSPLTRSWLAAAHGEVYAAHDRPAESLKAFDRAGSLLTDDKIIATDPYVALDTVHLSRWRGHALAQCSDPSAVSVLTKALNDLDPTFTRAETALRVDLAQALTALNEQSEAASQANQANGLAAKIGSTRQQRRIAKLRKSWSLARST
jgi:hypothetical protein